MRYTISGFVISTILLCLMACVPSVSQSTYQPNMLSTPTQAGWQIKPATNAIGVIQPALEYRLSFPISGVITKLFVEEGASVEIGAPIAKLDTTALEFEVQSAEVDLALAEARLRNASLGIPPAQITQAASEVIIAKARPQNAPRLEATVAAAEIAAAQARLENLLAQPFPEDVAIAQAEVDQQKINLDRRKLLLEQATLKSPISGTITQVIIHRGEFAGIGQPVVEISDLKNLIVKTEMNDTEVRHIQINDKAIIRLEVLPNIEVTGIVMDIRPKDGETLGNFEITIALTNPAQEVTWGMIANVQFND